MNPNPASSRSLISKAVFAAGLSAGLVTTDSYAQMLEEVSRHGTQSGPESLLEVPVSVTAFSQVEIGRAGIERPADFLLLTPNVTFANSESAGVNFMTIRGVSQVRNGESPVCCRD